MGRLFGLPLLGLRFLGIVFPGYRTFGGPLLRCPEDFPERGFSALPGSLGSPGFPRPAAWAAKAPIPPVFPSVSAAFSARKAFISRKIAAVSGFEPASAPGRVFFRSCAVPCLRFFRAVLRFLRSGLLGLGCLFPAFRRKNSLGRRSRLRVSGLFRPCEEREKSFPTRFEASEQVRGTGGNLLSKPLAVRFGGRRFRLQLYHLGTSLLPGEISSEASPPFSA